MNFLTFTFRKIRHANSIFASHRKRAKLHPIKYLFAEDSGEVIAMSKESIFESKINEIPL